MLKTKVKVCAKLNLSLDVVGSRDGYHQLETLVCSINLCDKITVKESKEKGVTLKEKGIKSGASEKENNAYKTAEKYLLNNNEKGLDITIKKDIFVGGGLGGSSADIAGVCKCLIEMGKLSQEEGKALADSMGSDSGYMLNGGFALLQGRGDKVYPLKVDKRLYFLLIKSNAKLLAKEVFAQFDSVNKKNKPCSKIAVEKLQTGDYIGFCNTIKNDLQKASQTFSPEIEIACELLKSVGANASLMTGSGPTVFGVFESKKQRDKAFKRLKKRLGKNVVKAHSV